MFGTAPMSSPVSRVLSFKTVIYLRRISLYGSSRPSDYRSDRPIRSPLLRMGFTWHKALPQCRWALTPPFHPYPRSGRFISVALSLESPPPGFLRHPVLWSSDFPHKRWCVSATVQTTQILTYIIRNTECRMRNEWRFSQQRKSTIISNFELRISH